MKQLDLISYSMQNQLREYLDSMPRMYGSVLDTKKSLNDGSLLSFVDAFPIENRKFKHNIWFVAVA